MLRPVSRRFGLVLALLPLAGLAYAEDQRTATVGMSGRIDQVVLPGSELEVKPQEDTRDPVVLRITNTYPHGTAFRYDFVWYGLEPGTYDLARYLRRKDGTPLTGLPPLKVEVQSVLPPGQIEPNRLEPSATPWLGGYFTTLAVLFCVWLLGLWAILFYRRGTKAATAAAANQPLTLADRLRPLVEGAVAGKLSQKELADLERTLLAYWRRRLRLEEQSPAAAIVELRRHAEAGPLLEQLEVWLHRPGPSGGVDVAGLLRPYQSVAPEALEVGR
jgi:hypothetical protein